MASFHPENGRKPSAVYTIEDEPQVHAVSHWRVLHLWQLHHTILAGGCTGFGTPLLGASFDFEKATEMSEMVGISFAGSSNERCLRSCVAFAHCSGLLSLSSASVEMRAGGGEVKPL